MSTKASQIDARILKFKSMYSIASKARDKLNTGNVHSLLLDEADKAFLQAQRAFITLRDLSKSVYRESPEHVIFNQQEFDYATELYDSAVILAEKVAGSSRDEWKDATRKLHNLSFNYYTLVRYYYQKQGIQSEEKEYSNDIHADNDVNNQKTEEYLFNRKSKFVVAGIVAVIVLLIILKRKS